MTVSCSSLMDFHLNRWVEEVYKLAFSQPSSVKPYLRWCVYHQNSCSEWITHTILQFLLTDKDSTTIAKTLILSDYQRDNFVSTMQYGNVKYGKKCKWMLLKFIILKLTMFYSDLATEVTKALLHTKLMKKWNISTRAKSSTEKSKD